MNSLVRWPIAAVTLVVALLFAPIASAIDSGDIVVASVKGEVQVTMNGAPRAVRAGTVLELPATVRTGRDGSIELRQGATSVSVGPETLLEFPALAKPGDPIDRIQQPRGNAFYDIGKREGRRLRIETPYLVGVVKGTQFNVAAQGESTTISLFEGLLEVRASDDSDVVELKAGEIASRKRGDKTISVIKMDGGKAPPTQRAPAGNGSGGNAAPPPAAPPRGTPVADQGDSLLAGRDLGALPVVSTVVDSVDDAGVSASAGGAPVSATVEVRPAIELVTPAAIDVGVSVNPGAGGIDAGVTASVDAGPAAVDVGVNVSAAPGGIDAGVSASVDAGPAAIDASTTAAVNLGGGSVNVDVGASAAVDLGTTASVDVGAAVGVDVGQGAGAAASVDVNAGVNAGPLSTDAGAGVAVDLGGDRGAANVDLGVNANVGNAIGADAGAAVAVNAGPAPDVAATVDVGANVAGVDAGVSTGVDVGTGNVDLGVNVAGVNLGLGVDLGLGLGTATTPDTSAPTTPSTPAPETTPTVDLGGLLDGLLRKPGKR